MMAWKKTKESKASVPEAARATIIQELIQRKFLMAEGKKKYLKPTDNAYPPRRRFRCPTIALPDE